MGVAMQDQVHAMALQNALERRLILERTGQHGDKRLLRPLAHGNGEAPKALGPVRIKRTRANATPQAASGGQDNGLTEK